MNMRVLRTMRETLLVLILIGSFIVFVGCEKIVSEESATKELLTCVRDCVSPPSCLVSWWPGDGNAEDIRGGNDGTLVNDVTFASGMVGQAFSFDGIDDYVSLPQMTTGSTYTIDAWIKTNYTGNDWQMIFAEQTVSGGEISLLGINPQGFIDLIHRDTNLIKLRVEWDAGNIQDGEWHFIVAGRDGSTMFCYVDGRLLTPNYLNTGNPNPVTKSRFIGIRDYPDSNIPGPFQGPFNGFIDELEFFDCVLSQSEIQALYNAGSVGK